MPERDRVPGSGGIPWLWMAVWVAVLARIGAALYLGNSVTVRPGTADQLSYHALALRVLEGHGFSFGTGWWPATPEGQPTAHWSYLYVLFLSGIYALVGPNPLAARLVQAVAVGVLQPLLTYAIAKRIFGPRVGLVSAAIVAGYAYFVYYAGTLMTESFFIVALLWSVHAAMRAADAEQAKARASGLAPWLALGAAVATAILLRQAVIVCVPVLLAWVAWRFVRAERPGAAREALHFLAPRLATTLAVIAVCILPWTIRNYRAFDQFVLLNTNAGFAFFWGNHPIHGERFVPILPGDGSLYGTLIPEELEDLDEASMDRALLKRGLGFVVDDPVRYLRLSASRTVEFMKFWPSPDSDRLSNLARVASFGMSLPFMVAGVILATVRTRSGASLTGRDTRADVWLILSVALVYALAHVLTWTLVRYRLPVDALLLPFAALSMERLWKRVADRARTLGSGVLAAG